MCSGILCSVGIRGGGGGTSRRDVYVCKFKCLLVNGDLYCLYLKCVVL